MDNIIFIGMPAVGKSTVGVVTAKRLGYQFIDTDLLIQEQEGKLLKEIIEEQGNDGFLKVEDRVNAGVEAHNAVISPGGSVVYCENRGVVLKDGQTLRDLYDERVPLFEKYADITICEDGIDFKETVSRVLDALEAL